MDRRAFVSTALAYVAAVLVCGATAWQFSMVAGRLPNRYWDYGQAVVLAVVALALVVALVAGPTHPHRWHAWVFALGAFAWFSAAVRVLTIDAPLRVLAPQALVCLGIGLALAGCWRFTVFDRKVAVVQARAEGA